MKVARNAAFRSERSDDWTAERIAQLSIQDIKQLRENEKESPRRRLGVEA